MAVLTEKAFPLNCFYTVTALTNSKDSLAKALRHSREEAQAT